MSKPAWARNDERHLLDDAQAQQEKLQAEVAAARLNVRGVGSLPLDREPRPES